MTPLQLGVLIPFNPAPNPCFVEQFVNLLVPYSVISGDGSIFTTTSTPYGTGIAIAANTSGTTVSKIARPSSSIQARTYSAKFQVVSNNIDDAGELGVQSGGSPVCFFNPRREAIFDSNRRFQLLLGSDNVLLGAGGEITLGNWFQIDMPIVAGAGNTIATITRLSDSVVVITQALPGNHSTTLIDSLVFLQDSNVNTAPAIWADIHICP